AAHMRSASREAHIHWFDVGEVAADDNALLGQSFEDGATAPPPDAKLRRQRPGGFAHTARAVQKLTNPLLIRRQVLLRLIVIPSRASNLRMQARHPSQVRNNNSHPGSQPQQVHSTSSSRLRSRR